MCQYTLTRYTCSHLPAREVTVFCETALAEGVCSEVNRDIIYTVAQLCPACVTDDLLASLETYSPSERGCHEAPQAEVATGAQDGPSRPRDIFDTPSGSVAIEPGVDVTRVNPRGHNGWHSLQSDSKESIPQTEVAQAKPTAPARNPRRYRPEESPRYPPAQRPIERPHLSQTGQSATIARTGPTHIPSQPFPGDFPPPASILPSQPDVPIPVDDPETSQVLPSFQFFENNLSVTDKTAAVFNGFGSAHICDPMDRRCHPVYGPCAVSVKNRVHQEEQKFVQEEQKRVQETRTERENTVRLQIAHSVLRVRTEEKKDEYSANEVVDAAISLWEQRLKDLDEEGT